MRRFLQLILLLIPLVASAATMRDFLGFDPATEGERAANAYIAQENLVLFRMRYPNGSYREFERNFERPDRLIGEQGWNGRITAVDGIVVQSGRAPDGNRWEWTFKSGRCVAFGKTGGEKRTFPYEAMRAPPGNIPPFYFGHEEEVAERRPDTAKAGRWKGVDKQVAKVLSTKWTSSRRLQWPFPNPNENGCLYATLALLSLGLLFVKRKWVQIVGGVVFLGLLVLLAMTASRGSFLALALGLLPIVGLRFKSILRSKAIWVLALLAIAAVAIWFCTHDSRLLTRGFKGASAWSNQVRLQMWKDVPQMAVEAPAGWAFSNVGGAYFSWYQPLDELNMPGSLINEHLTRIAGYGWWGRFGYVFVWSLGLLLLAGVAWRRRNAVALGVWLAFAVAGWFNPVFVNWMLWLVPVAAAVVFLCGKPWNVFTPRLLIWSGVATLLLSGGVLASLYALGSRPPSRGYPVRAENNRVYVKGMKPRIWVVDDGKALGGILACKDIRGWYVYKPEAPAIGYVRNVADLPKEKVHRLVLAGDSGDAWLRWMSEGGAEMQRNTPDEVVFISPPFPPSAVPEGLLQSCRVKLVVGEFAALYNEEYRQPPPWVVVVKGMELYHPGWMAFAAGG